MKVLYYRSGLTNGEIIDIENTLEAMQDLVKGYIEYVDFGDAFAVMNEEGKLRCMAYNRKLPWGDYIAGPFFIMGCTETEDGETVESDITEELERKYREIYDN